MFCVAIKRLFFQRFVQGQTFSVVFVSSDFASSSAGFVLADLKVCFPLASVATVKREYSVLSGVDVLQAMAEVGMPLLIHGEVTTAGVDIFDKEARFIEEVIKVGDCGARHSRHCYDVDNGMLASTAVEALFAVDPANVGTLSVC